VWQKSGKGSLKFGRPVWLRAGAPIDLSDCGNEIGDPRAMRTMTADLMSVLTAMVEDLRAGYPKRWTDEG
jgi:hypothetical protein